MQDAVIRSCLVSRQQTVAASRQGIMLLLPQKLCSLVLLSLMKIHCGALRF